MENTIENPKITSEQMTVIYELMGWAEATFSKSDLWERINNDLEGLVRLYLQSELNFYNLVQTNPEFKKSVLQNLKRIA